MSKDLSLQAARANRDLENCVMLTEVESIVAPLRRLDERTRASILVLVGLAELVTANRRSLAASDDGLGAEFAQSLKAVHGDGALLIAALNVDRLAERPLEGLTEVLRGLNLPAPIAVM
jgi:hypothetical protein